MTALITRPDAPIHHEVDWAEYPASPPQARSGQHGEAFDLRTLPQVRALAAIDRDLLLMDLLEPNTGHPLTFLLPESGLLGAAALATRADVPVTVRRPAACRADR